MESVDQEMQSVFINIVHSGTRISHPITPKNCQLCVATIACNSFFIAFSRYNFIIISFCHLYPFCVVLLSIL